jgi:hypothetical protein
MNPLRDFPRFLLNDVPEVQPKYAYRSLLVIVPIAVVSIGFFVWALVALSVWIALTVGIAIIALGFVTSVRLVSRIVPKRIPTNREF